MGNITNQIIKIEKNNYCDKLRYLIFVREKSAGWKERYIKNRIRENKDYIDPTGLSDFEYFLKLFPEPYFYEQYVIIVEGKIAGSASIDRDLENFCHITLEIYQEYRQRGLATELTSFIEEDLFKDETVKGIQIEDYSEHGESSKIAQKLGYDKKRNRIYQKYNSIYREAVDTDSNSKITPTEAVKSALEKGTTTDEAYKANSVEQSELNPENIKEGVKKDD